MPRRRARTWHDLPLVEVVWGDATIDFAMEGDLSDKESSERFGGLTTCSDVGYLIRKNRKVVVLAVGICRDDGSFRHSNTIPTNWVKEIIVLQRTPKSPTQPK